METQRESFLPLKRKSALTIAIPASFVSDVPHLREKTLRIGLVGRALAIFRVDEAVVYPDFPKTNQMRDINLVATILAYMETPQYLRKKLFKIQPELEYAGVLPPLRTPHHPLANRAGDLKVGEFREGVIVGMGQQGSLVDIGVEQPALLVGVKLKANRRVTVRITGTEKQKHPKVVLARPEEVKAYWGFQIKASIVPLGQMIRNTSFNLVVATSRKGKPMETVLADLAQKWKESRKILIAFGAPTQGLSEIAAYEHLELEQLAHFVVNTIPEQGTETVRTEEALYASLALFNTFG